MNIKEKPLSELNPEGYWEGKLSSSALSTATATFAIYLTDKDNSKPVIEQGLKWLACNVNDDGAWGDSPDSESNLSTTLLVWSVFSIAEDMDLDYNDTIKNIEKWISERIGGLSPANIANAVLNHYGNDKTFSVPILLMCAIAGKLGNRRERSEVGGQRSDEKQRTSNENGTYPPDNGPRTSDPGPRPPDLESSVGRYRGKGISGWKHVPQLPFELSILPHSFFRLIKLPVVSYALPALITMGIAKHHNSPSCFFPLRFLRNILKAKALSALAKIQPPNGGFLEATPLTSFVLMSLVSANLADSSVLCPLVLSDTEVSSVADKCLNFLLNSVREDGSWPIDTNLATWLTTLSVKALDKDDLKEDQKKSVRTWLLDQQFKERHPFTNAAPGGWAWTDLPGGTPDADDTSGALLALKKLDDGSLELKQAVSDGLKWLIDLQNDDGGIPTFCKGWGKLPFDRSCPDITAHALKAFSSWKKDQDEYLQRMLQKAEKGCLNYLKRSQMKDGSWIPLWFGNQGLPDKSNPVYGTSQVLIGLATYLADQNYNKEIQKIFDAGAQFLRNSQIKKLSIEELALAVKALSYSENSEDKTFVEKGRERLSAEKEFNPAPIGLYFASLWYSEKLYPLIFAVDAVD